MFGKNNDLPVASDKHDLNEEGALGHLDRLRVILPESGAVCACPILPTSEPLKPAVPGCCVPPGIGTASGHELLSRFDADLEIADRSLLTFEAVLQAPCCALGPGAGAWKPRNLPTVPAPRGVIPFQEGGMAYEEALMLKLSRPRGHATVATGSQPDDEACPSTDCPTHVILCRQLVKRFGKITAVDGIDLEVGKGQCLGLLGPNGAGKTTTVEIIEGLTKPDSGTVEVFGRAWGTGADRSLRERFGVQLQETQFSERLTVFETVRLFASFYSKGRRPSEILRSVGLLDSSDARVGQLSGGQRQRLAVACALVGEPELLFLDEPTAGLDPQARVGVWEVVEGLRSSGGTTLLTTHHMEEAARLCDRVAIMDRGRVIACDSPSGLVASLGARQVIEFRADCDLEEGSLSMLPGVATLARRGDSYHLTVTRIDQALPALMAMLDGTGGALRNLVTHQPTLEDVFMSLTGKGLDEE